MRIVSCQLRVFGDLLPFSRDVLSELSKDLSLLETIRRVTFKLVATRSASNFAATRNNAICFRLEPFGQRMQFSVNVAAATPDSLLCDAGFSLDFDLFVVCFAFGWLEFAGAPTRQPINQLNREIATNCVRDTIFFGIIDAIKMVYSPLFCMESTTHCAGRNGGHVYCVPFREQIGQNEILAEVLNAIKFHKL